MDDPTVLPTNDSGMLRDLPFRIDDIVGIRKLSQPLPGGIAPDVDSDLYKSPVYAQFPKAKRWDHRLTQESASRGPMTLRAMGSFLDNRGMITLGNGRPSSEYFPFQQLNLEVLSPPNFAEQSNQTTTSKTGKYDIRQGKSAYDLAISMNYGHGTGSAQLLRFVTEHVEMVHHPPYADWGCAMTIGSTSGLDVALRMFCNRGDYILLEEYTYTGAIQALQPLGINLLGIPMDEDGLIPAVLDNILSTWDEAARKAPKPFLLYTIPTGQNPTGVTQSLHRRREVYQVAEKHDLYIIEDDPYYFLQMELVEEGPTRAFKENGGLPVEDYLKQLVPSYLALDVCGRVMRLDSTAKSIAPGLRCSWLTASSQIVDRFRYHQDVSAVCPSGVSQLVMYKLLEESWGHQGFFDWLQHLCADYTHRRDTMIDACESYLPSEICRWNTPKAGMFHWIEVIWQKHPSLAVDSTKRRKSGFDKVEECIFLAAVNKGVLCCRGSWFQSELVGDRMFFRTTFSSAPREQVREAVRRLGAALNENFGLAGMKQTSL